MYLFLKNEDFSAIDLAYETLPASTEQIIHPDKYDAGEEPIPVSIPDPTELLGAGWTALDRNVMGELFLRSYFESDLDRETAAMAVAGWGGDEFLLLETPTGEDALVMSIMWDTEEDASEFSDAFRVYGEKISGETWTEAEWEYGHILNAGDMGTIWLGGGGAETRIIIALDSESTSALFEAMESLKPIAAPS